MAQNHVTDEKAFELLREASQRLNLKVSEIADRGDDQSATAP